MRVIAIKTLQNKQREVIASLTNADGQVSILFRDRNGNIYSETIHKGD